MKKLLLLSFLFFLGIAATQAQKFPGIDKSPLDISVWRAERGAPVMAKVIYSRPYAKERYIWGGLIPYGSIWRTGANEAPEITFYKDVMIGGKEVKAGTYTLFTEANEGSLDIVLNSDLNQWGAYAYDASKDVVRASAAVLEKTAGHVENFSIVFDNQEDGSTHMVLAWGDQQARIPIK